MAPGVHTAPSLAAYQRLQETCHSAWCPVPRVREDFIGWGKAEPSSLLKMPPGDFKEHTQLRKTRRNIGVQSARSS